MNTALNELEQLSLGVMAQVLLHTEALPLQAWRNAEQINAALGTAARHARVVRRWLVALGGAGLLRRRLHRAPRPDRGDGRHPVQPARLHQHPAGGVVRRAVAFLDRPGITAREYELTG